MAERAPPYEKRPKCTELWRGVLKTHYRSSAESERKDLGVGYSVRRMMNKPRSFEICGDMLQKRDLAVAIADDYEKVARLDPELASPRRKMGGE